MLVFPFGEKEIMQLFMQPALLQCGWRGYLCACLWGVQCISYRPCYYLFYFSDVKMPVARFAFPLAVSFQRFFFSQLGKPSSTSWLDVSTLVL